MNDTNDQQAPTTDGDDKRLTKRYGWLAKMAAIGFIAVIAFGNFWLAHALFAPVVPEWVGLGFMAGMAVAACGGFAIALKAAWVWLQAYAAARNP